MVVKKVVILKMVTVITVITVERLMIHMVHQMRIKDMILKNSLKKNPKRKKRTLMHQRRRSRDLKRLRMLIHSLHLPSVTSCLAISVLELDTLICIRT
jgi:hypothetical protein